MYAINGIDRTNLAVARIAGMEEDLGINQGERYSIALLIFFIPYVLYHSQGCHLSRSATYYEF